MSKPKGAFMTEHRTHLSLAQPARYEIQVQGLISQGWLDYLDELQIVVDGEDGWAITTLTGCMLDQAALQGMLQKLYSLGLVLLRVERKEN
jgi:hypothetical protein